MAKIYCNKKNTPGKRRGALLLLEGIVTVFALTGLFLRLYALLGLGLLGLIVCLWVRTAASRNDSARLAGEAGENATALVIQQLPDGYYGFRNLNIPYEGRTSEIDMVVVGPTGVYIIETKNLNGTVVGNFEDSHWVLHKTGRRGGSYQRSFYNPLKQVGTHVYRLAHFLRENGCQVHVNAMVFFANEHPVQIYGQPGKFPVYSGEVGAKLIFQSILSGKDALPTQTVHRICQLLYPYL